MQSEGNPSKVQPEARLFQPLKLKDRVTVAFPAHDYPAFQAKWEDIRPPADWLGAAKESKDIVIVGAGMAGITAAQHLRRARVKSVVFESRSRVGGRMCSFKPSEAVDAVNIGANYLHGCVLEGGNPIFNVSKTTSLRFIDNVVDNHRYLKQPSAQEREGYGISAELNAPPPDLGSKSAMNTPDEADVICQKADFDEDTIAAMYELYGKLDAAVSRKGLQLFRSSDGSDASVYELIQEVLQEGTFTALLAQLDEKHRTSEFMDLLHARLTSQLAYVCPIDQLSARDMGVTYEVSRANKLCKTLHSMPSSLLTCLCARIPLVNDTVRLEPWMAIMSLWPMDSIPSSRNGPKILTCNLEQRCWESYMIQTTSAAW
eukprot:TRINITY_DN12657_c1_g3_i12.p1 TRINITY_DN12657_c1_g3~~TRINITY_DN12657_c1_g3_i12.p1  ORF type:complete len:373 (+),score=53.19 TRINITY_DN12657_c1_g3_i12:71-1189(+)